MGSHHIGAWLLGLEGAALLRAQAEGATATDIEVRFEEIRTILDAVRSGELDLRWESEACSVGAGYAAWSLAYDGPNPLIDVEEPVVHQLLSDVAPGVALDAACGTGRLAGHLAGAGHCVIGLDASSEMLALGYEKLPDVHFIRGDLRQVPLGDGTVDVAVCSLALTHLPDLDEPLRELARVVRPRGTVVISDIHWVALYLGGVPYVTLPDGTIGRLPASRFTAADYIGAASRAGLTVEACHEPGWPDHGDAQAGSFAQRWCPDAARLACVGTPAVVAWRFRKDRALAP